MAQGVFNMPRDGRGPGVFVTGTDTDVGKTVAACLIAWTLRRAGRRVGACKPYATGCAAEAGTGRLIASDGVALAAAAWGAGAGTARHELVCPLRFIAPAAPGPAAQAQGLMAVEHGLVGAAIAALEASCDVMVVEGVGGLLVPLCPADPGLTVLDLAQALGYPVVVVARTKLGTLNHTAMTVRLLRQAGLTVAGLVFNGASPEGGAGGGDVAERTNAQWLRRMTGAPVLATLPRAADLGDLAATAAAGTWPEALARPMAGVDWMAMARSTGLGGKA